MKLVKNVYEEVCGEYADEADCVIQNVRIQNEFEEGKPAVKHTNECMKQTADCVSDWV